MNVFAVTSPNKHEAIRQSVMRLCLCLQQFSRFSKMSNARWWSGMSAFEHLRLRVAYDGLKYFPRTKNSVYESVVRLTCHVYPQCVHKENRAIWMDEERIYGRLRQHFHLFRPRSTDRAIIYYSNSSKLPSIFLRI